MVIAAKIVKGAIKGAVKAPGAVGRFILPRGFDVEKQLGLALKRGDVRKAYESYEGDPETFKQHLRGYLTQVDDEHRRLYGFARTLDAANRATIPIDGALDYLNYMGGVGAAARAIKSLASGVGYLAYDAYYTAKTGDVIGGLVTNPAYEVLSWASPGALPHIMRHYTKQLDKLTVKEASKRFLRKLRASNLEDRISEEDVVGRIEPEKLRKAA